MIKKVQEGFKNLSKNTTFKRLAIVVPIAVVPIFVSAGVFSVVGGVALGEIEIKKQPINENLNSQTMAVLQVNLEAHKNSKSTGGPNISIIDETALRSGFSPQIADIDLSQATTTTGQISVYTVKSGDTISGIAQKYGVSTNTIRWANNLGTKGLIKVGQDLTILPVTGIRHRVSKGETLGTIADKFNSDLSEIAVFNGLEVDAVLESGSEIIVPDGEMGETIIVKSETKKDSSKTKTVTTTKKNTYGTARSVDSYYTKPTKGVVTQWFHGPHQALDIGAPIGTPIVAMADGVVIVAKGSGYNGGYGKMVTIAHPNNTQTLYAHMNQVDVVAGQKVTQGQGIGEVGNTGRSTGPHLHYEVRGVGKPVKTPIIYSKP